MPQFGEKCFQKNERTNEHRDERTNTGEIIAPTR